METIINNTICEIISEVELNALIKTCKSIQAIDNHLPVLYARSKRIPQTKAKILKSSTAIVTYNFSPGSKKSDI